MSNPLRWGIIAAGGIAKLFAKGLARTDTGDLLAVASRSKNNAKAFAKEFGVKRAYEGYAKLLGDKDVDAVYIATPHPMHAKWCIKAAEAGKHILCEKPLTMNRWEAEAVIEAAREHDVFLMEAFMYRCHPQTHRIVELIRDGAIGQVRIIQASFGFDASSHPDTHRIFANELGGGGILDVGCYAVSMSRLVAGAATGKPFADPIDVTGAGHIGETGVDDWAVGTLQFDHDIVAQVRTAARVGLDNDVHIYGSEGSIHVPLPWFASREPGVSEIVVNGKKVEIKTDKELYEIEADTVAANIDRREAPSPAMSWADTLGNMATLDRWREAIGLRYESEKPRRQQAPIHSRPLSWPTEPRIPTGRIDGMDKTLSRLVLGCDAMQHTTGFMILADAFFELGGNGFDTAHLYSGGDSERTLGWWVKHRGVRKQVAIITKGAHTPDNFPDRMGPQLAESLERLQTDHVDLYLLHRDTPDVPVGEWADALHEQHQAGRIRAFGGSNWTVDRVAAYNAYATNRGQQPMTALSNNFSLARSINPLWEGCVACSDPMSRQWLAKTRLPNVAWSSQARGFFVDGRAAPNKLDDEQMVHAWYSDDNFERLNRARQLAKQKGVSTINIALAYVLQQPFPQFAVIGPHNLAELRTTMPALDVELSVKELVWLNLESD